MIPILGEGGETPRGTMGERVVELLVQCAEQFRLKGAGVAAAVMQDVARLVARDAGRETQGTICEWGRDVFGDFDSAQRGVGRTLKEFAELVEELGYPDESFSLDGLATELLRDCDRIDVLKTDREKVAGEMADVLIVLYRAAEAAGVDLQKAVDAKMRTNREREWDVGEGGDGRHAG